MKTLDLVVAISQLVAAIALTFTALFALRAIWTQQKQTRSAILLECLRSYVTIREIQTEALHEDSPLKCFEYYRAVFDLHWSEFQLWYDKQIGDSVMWAWLDARQRNFASDKLTVTVKGQPQITKYADVWEKLKKEGYFAPKDPFVAFMNKVHEKETDIKKEVIGDRGQWKRKF